MFLGDFIKPINVVMLKYDELQKKNENKDEEICGMYDSTSHTIYMTNDDVIPVMDVLMHEISHALIAEQDIIEDEEHKADILAIRLKKLLENKEKIYVFTQRGVC